MRKTFSRKAAQALSARLPISQSTRRSRFSKTTTEKRAKWNCTAPWIVDPNNNYASDLLATIDMSEGEVQSALRTWNRAAGRSSATFSTTII